MPLVTYNTGKPTERGVYAVRVPHDTIPDMLMDKFLIWFDGKWGYLGSDMNYRGKVLGWLGPLQRKLPQAPQAPVPVRNGVLECVQCGFKAPELEWNEVWSHKEGGFISSCCPKCQNCNSRYRLGEGTDGVLLRGLPKLKYTIQFIAQKSVADFESGVIRMPQIKQPLPDSLPLVERI